MQQASNSGHVPDGAQAASLDAKGEPGEEQAPWDDIIPGEAGTTTAAAAVKQPDDIFGPADEFD